MLKHFGFAIIVKSDALPVRGGLVAVVIFLSLKLLLAFLRRKPRGNLKLQETLVCHSALEIRGCTCITVTSQIQYNHAFTSLKAEQRGRKHLMHKIARIVHAVIVLFYRPVCYGFFIPAVKAVFSDIVGAAVTNEDVTALQPRCHIADAVNHGI